MRYIDSGSRDPSTAVATWLASEAPASVQEFRWQAGYFSVDGLAAVGPILEHLAHHDCLVSGVIGSNESSTVHAHVVELVRVLALPRPNARLGVACFEDGLYHPKTYHITRRDGTQAAFVGSANFTAPGLGAGNVEAGMLLDTRERDDPAVLNAIAAAVDDWFAQQRDGLELVQGLDDVERLLHDGILSAAPTRRVRRPAADAEGEVRNQRPRLGTPVPLRWPLGARLRAEAEVPVLPPPPEPRGPLPAVPRAPYPEFVLFAPGQESATVGAEALSGHQLPNEAAGIILRLNKDTLKLWTDGAKGTANLSVPLATVSTFRFGLSQERRYMRARAEFFVAMRFLSDNGIVVAPMSQSAIMIYGYLPGETSSEDVRLNISSTPTSYLLREIHLNGLPVPAKDDVALVEWPTAADPVIRITFIARDSAAFVEAENILAAADANGTRVGRKACWLEPGMSPPW